MRVGRVASTASELLVAARGHQDGVLHGSCAHRHEFSCALARLRPDTPLREASRGRMSKMSTPSTLPRISRRSRPVDCSRSVGTVPSAAPGPNRSSKDLTSARTRDTRQPGSRLAGRRGQKRALGRRDGSRVAYQTASSWGAWQARPARPWRRAQPLCRRPCCLDRRGGSQPRGPARHRAHGNS